MISCLGIRFFKLTLELETFDLLLDGVIPAVVLNVSMLMLNPP
jgi:hypothetical protein